MTFGYSTYRCGNYSREETIQGWKLFAEIRYLVYLILVVTAVAAVHVGVIVVGGTDGDPGRRG